MDLFSIMIWIVARDIGSPVVLPAALAIGWWARDARILLVGVVLIASARIIPALMAPLPPDAARVLWVEPLHLVAPLAISFAACRLRRWLRSRDAAAPQSILPRAIRTAVGAALGACAGGALFLSIGLAVITLAGIHDREGGEGYLLAFVVVPLGLFIGLIFGAVIAWRRSGRRPICARAEGATP